MEAYYRVLCSQICLRTANTLTERVHGALEKYLPTAARASQVGSYGAKTLADRVAFARPGLVETSYSQPKAGQFAIESRQSGVLPFPALVLCKAVARNEVECARVRYEKLQTD